MMTHSPVDNTMPQPIVPKSVNDVWMRWWLYFFGFGLGLVSALFILTFARSYRTDMSEYLANLALGVALQCWAGYCYYQLREGAPNAIFQSLMLLLVSTVFAAIPVALTILMPYEVSTTVDPVSPFSLIQTYILAICVVFWIFILFSLRKINKYYPKASRHKGLTDWASVLLVVVAPMTISSLSVFDNDIFRSELIDVAHKVELPYQHHSLQVTELTYNADDNVMEMAVVVPALLSRPFEQKIDSLIQNTPDMAPCVVCDFYQSVVWKTELEVSLLEYLVKAQSTMRVVLGDQRRRKMSVMEVHLSDPDQSSKIPAYQADTVMTPRLINYILGL